MRDIYSRDSQTLCTICQQRVQWNGKRWIHLIVYAATMHDARADLALICDSSDPWAAEKLKLTEAARD